MTDMAEAGSAPAGNSAEATQFSAGGSGTETGGDFLSALSEDNRKVAEAKGWTGPDKVDEMLSSYRGLEGKIGSAINLPGDDAKPEDRQAFFDKVSKAWTPEGPDGYQFSLPDNLPENFAYDKDFASEAQKWFHDAKLSPTQAQFLHDKWVSTMAGAQGALAQTEAERQEAQQTAMQEAHKALQSDWGEAGTEGYKQALGKSIRVAEHLGIMDELTEAGIVSAPDENGNRAVLRPAMVSKLPAIFDAILGEDSLGQGGVSTNPFADSTRNLTEQSNIIRNDPSRAAALIRAAGGDPAKYGLKEG